jgi:tetratricopeptide (TPR) repeat protein
MGRAGFALGNLKQAAFVIEGFLSEEHSPPLGHAAIAELESILVSVYFERGDVQLAQRTAERALAVLDETVPLRTQAVALTNAARVLVDRGELEEALELVGRARFLVERLQSRRDVGRLHIMFAFLCLELSPPKLQEAEDHLDQAESILSEIGATAELALATTERSRLAMLRRRPKQAITLADRTITEESAEELERGRAYFVKGRALAELGRHEEARESFDHALDIFGAHDSHAQLAATWREVGELAAARGDLEGSTEAFRSALEAHAPRRFRP